MTRARDEAANEAGDRHPPRIFIANLTPAIDGGRYAVKRILGEACEVGADILKDGHDRLAARILFRGPEDESWTPAPLAYDYDSDRWSGHFEPCRLGRWLFTVEAWSDHFGTWRHALRARLAARLDSEGAEAEGVSLVRRAATAARAHARAELERVATELASGRARTVEEIDALLTSEVEALVRDHLVPTDLTRHAPALPIVVDRERARFAAWYELFPRSQSPVPDRPGSLVDAERRLPELAALGFDVVYLPPIHPIGLTNRKGRNNSPQAGPEDPGSPWAIGNRDGGHTAVDPGLGTIEDFDRFVRTAERLGMEVALDYAPHCSPDHPWCDEHPEWFRTRADGSIACAENPPHVFEDIYPFDFWCQDRIGLWSALRDVLLFWIARGVRTFRVDNPHTKPFAFWEWVIADITRTHPDVIFLAEAFTRPKTMKALAKLGFTQSYTYFIWRTGAPELSEHLTELTGTDMADYLRGHLFTNTPDVLHAYLQTGGRAAFRVRLLLAATLSPLYGIYSGFELCEATAAAPDSEEYLDSEKYQIRTRDWTAAGNINEDIAILNRLRREQRALQLYTNLTFHTSENDQVLFYRKAARDGDLLVAVNVDPHRAQETMVHVPLAALGIHDHESFLVEDLLSGERYAWRGARNYVRLDPTERVGQIFRVVPS